MIVNYNNQLTFGPIFYRQISQKFSSLPSIFLVLNVFGEGSSASFNDDASVSALAEYLERFHFRYDVPVSKRATYAHQNDAFTTSLSNLINQIKLRPSSPDAHIFELVEAKNILSGEIVLLPRAFFSMMSFSKADKAFIPFTDSSGSAIHRTVDDSELAALLEYIERQSLMCAWLTGRIRYSLSPELFSSRTALFRMIKMLKSHGELYILLIDSGLPGYSVITFYFSKHESDPVQYCVGASCRGNIFDAVERALVELWQGFSFLLGRPKVSELPGKKYQNGFVESNSYNTKYVWPFDWDDLPRCEDEHFLKMQHDYSRQALIEGLKAFTDQLYIYNFISEYYDHQLCYSKIFSPDFYLHFAFDEPLNHNNKYALSLQVDPEKNINALKCIPFP